MLGDPDPSRISTSYVERQNLTMRIGDALVHKANEWVQQKIENHIASVAIPLHALNFGRPHKRLANPYPCTPAMEAGVDDHVWSPAEVVELFKLRNYRR